jgi:DNA repair photolyase
VARDVHKLKPEDVVMLSTTSDPWAPEAQRLQLGDQCAEIILCNSPATIVILTKNAAVSRAFELLSQYRDRVWLSLSITAPKSRENLIRTLEPSASSISDRLKALHEAHHRGLRTYGMLCPCLPGITDSTEALEEIFESVLSCGAQNIWLEPVNPRGNGLVRCVQALSAAGFNEAASAIDAVRNRARWNEYAVRLIQNAQRIAEKKSVLNRLHVLLYSNQLSAESMAAVKEDPRGIIWL